MRILAIADVEEPWLYDHLDRHRLDEADLIISCGDLSARYLEFVATMARVPLLYVPGNHDEAYVSAPPEGCITSMAGSGRARDCASLGQAAPCATAPAPTCTPSHR